MVIVCGLIKQKILLNPREMMKQVVIVPCAGTGSRFNAPIAKQYLPLLDKTVLDWTLQAFIKLEAIDEIYVICQQDDAYINDYISRYPSVSFLRVGGLTRTDTVRNALENIELADNDWVLVHDAARCCVDYRDIEQLLIQLSDRETGGILASKATDTLKQVDTNGNIVKTIDRTVVYQAQTPQMFRKHILVSGLNYCREKNITITDEASAVEALGREVAIVESIYSNLKITYPDDLLFAASILASRL